MHENRLRLNPSKTEIIWLGSSRRLGSCKLDALNICGSNITPAEKIRNLGVIFDRSLTFADHVSNLSRTCYYHLRQLRTIRRSLTTEPCHALVRAAVISRVDYCNGLLHGITKFSLTQLNGVLRSAARLVLRLPRASHITIPMRNQLHWLELPARCTYKLCTYTHRCLNGNAPVYLSTYCLPVAHFTGRSHLRSASTGTLLVPVSTTQTFGPRAFAVSCPSAWNALPAELRNPNINYAIFRKKLKTHLFSQTM